MKWLKRIYLIILRDFAAAQYMAGMQTLPLESMVKHAQPGDTVGAAMARKSYEAADALIKTREQRAK